jgi:hypothetical protein
MSKGEDRVRTKFNPSANGLVDQIKQKSAELIDLCESIKPVPDTDAGMEKLRLIAMAQTSYEEAAMWAVKAATG